MKELSIEEKAKRYDKALHKAKRIINVCVDDNTECRSMIACIQELFPELKESEDERIKGNIIATIHLYYGEPLEDEAKEMIDWLEKQGKYNIGISEATKQKLEDNLNKALEKETPESWNEFLDEKKSYGQREECSNCQMNYAGECKGSCAMKRSEQKLAEKYNITGIGSKHAEGKLEEMLKNITDKTDWLQELQEKLDSLSKEDFEKVMAKYSRYGEEEPVSEDLEKASEEWLEPQLDKSYAKYGEGIMLALTRFDGYAMLDAIEFGAKWKEQQLEKNRLARCDAQKGDED